MSSSEAARPRHAHPYRSLTGRRPAPLRSDRFVSRLRVMTIAAVLSCIPAQVFIDDTLTNFICSAMAMLSAVLTFLYTLRIDRFRRAPLSSLMVLGFNISALSGALFIQTATLRAITYNLDSPVETFAVLCFTQVLVIAVHYGYLRSRFLQHLRALFTCRICRPLGLLKSPADLQLWTFGLVGCAATVLSARNYTEGVEFGNASAKFAVAYVPFAVAPFFIPMRASLFGDRSRGRGGWLLLSGYALLLISVAIVNNSRGTFSAGFLTLGLCLLVAIVSGNLRLNRRSLAIAAGVACVVVPLFVALSDLATAMVVARDERSTVSATELIQITLRNFQDKALLTERRLRDAVVEGGEYNENYVENPLFARFVYTKFVDVNLTNAFSLSQTQEAEIRSRAWNRVLAIAPTPILNALHIDVDKGDLGYSSGDIYSYIAHGRELGSYTTGSEVPDGLTIFGALFWPFLALMVLFQFILYDGFSTRDADGRLVVSAAGLVNVVPIFTLGIMQESVADQISATFRGIPQLILLYWVVYVASAAPLAIIARFRPQPRRVRPQAMPLF